MTIEEMHYDFKQKLNKIDSQKYRNLRIPEIDWKLNEAQEVFVKRIAEPRTENSYGFEVNQRIIDDVRTLVKEGQCQVALNTTYPNSVVADYPDDYWFHLSSYTLCNKGTCTNVRIGTRIVQHDDTAEESPFDRSSFEWREVNARFISDGIRLFHDGTFDIVFFCMDYIKTPLFIHYAQGTSNNQYRLPDGTLLTGKQDSELPEHTHREIVDLAVLITTGDLQIPDYQIKNAKINLVN